MAKHYRDFSAAQQAAAQDPNRDTTNDFVIENGKLYRYKGPGGDVTVPDGVTAIADHAFAHCQWLTTIRIPDSVTELGESPFRDCENLTGIHIPRHLLQGHSARSVTSLFVYSIWNQPQCEAKFIRRLLDGTDDYSEGFRELFTQALTRRVTASKWLQTGIEEDRPDWVRRILEWNENLDHDILESCMELALTRGRQEIHTILRDYQRSHSRKPEQDEET